MQKTNPFHHKTVERKLLAQFMPGAVDKRKTRSLLRDMARYVEQAYLIGQKDGRAGKRLVGLDELRKPDESPMMRTIGRYAYTSYKRGHEIGAKAVG